VNPLYPGLKPLASFIALSTKRNTIFEHFKVKRVVF
jgi:hypothetical protein